MVTISDHTPYNFLYVNGDLQCVFQRQNDGKTLACLSKRVSRCWQRTAMRKGGSWLRGSICGCADDRRVIVGREKFPQFARCIVRGILYYLCSMFLRQIFCQFTGSAAQTHCARRPQLVSKKFWRKKFSRNFHAHRKNFCLSKISHYTVCHGTWWICYILL